MTKLSGAAWAAHNLGLATCFGGQLFGKVALNANLGVLEDEEERGKMLNTAWNRYNLINTASFATAAVTWFPGRLGLSGEEIDAQPRSCQGPVVRGWGADWSGQHDPGQGAGRPGDGGRRAHRDRDRPFLPDAGEGGGATALGEPAGQRQHRHPRRHPRRHLVARHEIQRVRPLRRRLPPASVGNLTGLPGPRPRTDEAGAGVTPIRGKPVGWNRTGAWPVRRITKG